VISIISIKKLATALVITIYCTGSTITIQNTDYGKVAQSVVTIQSTMQGKVIGMITSTLNQQTNFSFCVPASLLFPK
jgi:hypothetical protein